MEITDEDGNVIDTIEGVEVDQDGSFEVEWTVPEGTEPGSLTVTATDDEDPEVSASASLVVVDPAPDVEAGEIDIDIEHEVIRRGETQIGYGYGYEPGTEVRGFMNSEPTIDLGVQVADENGTVVFTWEIPDEALIDDHTFSLTAEGYDDQSIGFEVVAGAGAAGDADDDDLATTGAGNIVALTVLGLLLLLLGSGALVYAKRRRAASTH